MGLYIRKQCRPRSDVASDQVLYYLHKLQEVKRKLNETVLSPCSGPFPSLHSETFDPPVMWVLWFKWEISFVTSCLCSCTPSFFWKGVYFKKKIICTLVISFQSRPLQKGDKKQFWQRCHLWKIVQSLSKYFIYICKLFQSLFYCNNEMIIIIVIHKRMVIVLITHWCNYHTYLNKHTFKQFLSLDFSQCTSLEKYTLLVLIWIASTGRGDSKKHPQHTHEWRKSWISHEFLCWPLSVPLLGGYFTTSFFVFFLFCFFVIFHTKKSKRTAR